MAVLGLVHALEDIEAALGLAVQVLEAFVAALGLAHVLEDFVVVQGLACVLEDFVVYALEGIVVGGIWYMCWKVWQGWWVRYVQWGICVRRVLWLVGAWFCA